jgi:threonine dehydratase
LEEDVTSLAVDVGGVLRACRRVYRHLKPTPLIHYPLLSDLLGCEAYVKHENCLPTGAFKIRGGLNLIAGLSEEEKRRGVATATRGNHGQSIALACRIHGVRCTVVVPEGNNPEKNEAMASFGAEVLVAGKDFDEARLKVEELRRERGVRYVHSGNEPPLIHGVGTYALEILQELPEVEVLLVPIGGGSGASGVLTVKQALAPRLRVIGVQAERAPAVYLSWKTGRVVETDSADTVADGLATRVPFELPLSIIRKHIDAVVTVGEEEILGAVFHYFRTTHHVAEPAAAAPLAAALNLRRELSGKKVVLVLSGGNIQVELFRDILRSNGSR